MPLAEYKIQQIWHTCLSTLNASESLVILILVLSHYLFVRQTNVQTDRQTMMSCDNKVAYFCYYYCCVMQWFHIFLCFLMVIKPRPKYLGI